MKSDDLLYKSPYLHGALLIETLRGGKVKILAFLEDEETGEKYVKFCFLDELKQEVMKQMVARSELNAKKLQQIMLKFGGINCDAKFVFEEYKNTESKAMKIKPVIHPICDEGFPDDVKVKTEEETVPQIYMHRCVGWYGKGDDIKFFAEKTYLLDKTIDSEYRGSLKIGTVGKFSIYKEMLEKIVAPSVPLTAALAIGVSATVLEYAKRVWGYKILNPICHFSETTSKGKTITGEMIASLGGCPDRMQRDSLAFSFDCTDNAFAKKIGRNYGYAVLIDDTSLSKTRDMSQVLYGLADGREKDRLGKLGEYLQSGVTFTTTVVTTGEGSILVHCNGNEGLRARVFEFDGVVWTKSGEEANEIEQIVHKNYGFVTPMIAQELLKDSKVPKWQSRMEEWEQRFIGDAYKKEINTGITGRVSQTLALFMVSGEIVQAVLGIQLKTEDIYKFYFNNILEKLGAGENLGSRCYEFLCTYYAENKASFMSREYGASGDGVIMKSPLGIVIPMKSTEVIDGVNYDRTVCFTKEQMAKVLKEGGFQDAKVCMRALKEMRLLMTKDSKRLEAEFTINNEKVKGYRIKIQEEYYDLMHDEV